MQGYFADKRILVLLAHPDDETLGCGATLHRAVEEGAIVRCIFPVKRVISQCINATQILGISSIHFGKYQDNRMDKYPLADVAAFFEKEVQKFKPHIVILHHWNCTNQDHRVCYEAGIIANRDTVAQLWCCEIPSSTGYLKPVNFEPNFYVALHYDSVNAKTEAMKKYITECRDYPHVRSIGKLIALMEKRGGEMNQEYAEAFVKIREIV